MTSGHNLGGYRTKIVEDLARKVRDDVAAAIVRTMTLSAGSTEGIPIALGALPALVKVLAIVFEKVLPVSTEEAADLALEIVIMQCDVLAETPVDVAQQRLSNRLAARGLARLAGFVKAMPL